MSAQYDTVVGGAWVDEGAHASGHGPVGDARHSSSARAFMFNEQGKPVFANGAHMTNTNIVPILSAIANVNLDWEWQYGKRDWQDRFAPDLTGGGDHRAAVREHPADPGGRLRRRRTRRTTGA